MGNYVRLESGFYARTFETYEMGTIRGFLTFNPIFGQVFHKLQPFHTLEEVVRLNGVLCTAVYVA